MALDGRHWIAAEDADTERELRKLARALGDLLALHESQPQGRA